MYLLITIIIQTGITDVFFEEFRAKSNCLKERKEKLLHDNEVTKVAAYCIKEEK